MADAPKSKAKRTVKPVYVVMQVKGPDGNALKLTKEDVTILNTYKSADELLTRLEGGGLPEGAFYKRIALA